MAEDGKPGEKSPRLKRRIPFLIIIGLLIASAWYGSRAVGFAASHRLVLVPSGSMAPAILPGDRLLLELNGEAPKRGEIWTIAGPNGMLIKRVVGLPGETVAIVGGKVLIDGEPLEEPYLAAPMAQDLTMDAVKLGPGDYWLMGDTRGASLDSRAWGPVPRDRLLGRTERRVWPSNRIGPVR
jgi:signal peptidase I